MGDKIKLDSRWSGIKWPAKSDSEVPASGTPGLFKWTET